MLIKGFFGITVEHAGGDVWGLPVGFARCCLDIEMDSRGRRY